DGSRPLAEIGRLLGELYDADAAVIEADMMEIIADLSDSGLVVETAGN
ncbi:MAG: PqqD family protein, partial [Candidatus Electrothrix sp. ATG2]|nr:PqqD family protein [Candidatus Electrothrix sp. ATG2]